MKLTLPIPLSDVQVGGEMVPMLRMTDWSKLSSSTIFGIDFVGWMSPT